MISIQSAGGLTALSGRGATIQYALVGPDLQKLDDYTARARDALLKNPLLVDVDRTYLPGRPELRLNIDRQRAADLGVRVQDVSQTVNALVAGQKVTTFNAASDQYDVRAAGAGLLPPHAGVDCVGDGAHRHRRAGAAAHAGDRSTKGPGRPQSTA